LIEYLGKDMFGIYAIKDIIFENIVPDENITTTE